MQQSFVKLLKTEKRFLLSLIQNREKNDSDIAKELKMSKGTVSRTRKKLEERGLLAGSSPNLNMEKFGVSFYTLMLFQWNAYSDSKLTKKMEEEFVSTPQTVYFAEGSTPNSKYVAMMGFLDFEDYNNFLEEFRAKYGGAVTGLESLFIQQKRVLKQSSVDLAKILVGGA